MKKIYISGPISGTNDYNERFKIAENYLIQFGHDVINPVVFNENLPKNTDGRVYMSECLRVLCLCDTIYMLKDWQKSRGARLEKTVAEHIGLNVIYEI